MVDVPDVHEPPLMVVQEYTSSLPFPCAAGVGEHYFLEQIIVIEGSRITLHSRLQEGAPNFSFTFAEAKMTLKNLTSLSNRSEWPARLKTPHLYVLHFDEFTGLEIKSNSGLLKRPMSGLQSAKEFGPGFSEEARRVTLAFVTREEAKQVLSMCEVVIEKSRQTKSRVRARKDEEKPENSHTVEEGVYSEKKSTLNL
tara:strand:+ start:20 stop:610 length:591 start_codon:yes stop_codon:yes gene_type:complete